MGNLVRCVAALKIADEAVENRGCDRDITQRRQAIADSADVMIDPENLLHHHHAAPGLAGGIGAIGPERVLLGRGQGELLTQVCLP